MTAKAVARIGDTVTGTCWAPGHGRRAFTGLWETGSGSVKAGGLYVVRIGDTGTTDCGHTFKATTGSAVFKADGLAVHRVDDLVVVGDGGEGSTTGGSETVSSD